MRGRLWGWIGLAIMGCKGDGDGKSTRSEAEDGCGEWHTTYIDRDGDGFGGEPVVAPCTPVAGTVAEGGDCDDSSAVVHPGASEVCDDGVVNDCLADPEAAARQCNTLWPDHLDEAPLRWTSTAVHPDMADALHLGGDLNGDGIHDLALYQNPLGIHEEGVAMAWVVFGGDLNPGPINERAGAVILGGGDDAERIGGWAPLILGVEDVHGDGYDDLVLGNDVAAFEFLGTLRVFAGPLVGTHTASDATLVFPVETSDLSQGMAVPGDINDDGTVDLLLAGSLTLAAVPANSTGNDSWWDLKTSLWWCDAFRHGPPSIADAGDTNGDGVADIVIGVSRDGDGGALFRILGSPALNGEHDLGPSADGAPWGQAGEKLGIETQGVGDVNGDGLADVLVGAPSDEAEGSVYLVLGRNGGLAQIDATWRGDHPTASIGRHLATLDDVDGDGVADFVTSAYAPSSDARGPDLLLALSMQSEGTHVVDAPLRTIQTAGALGADSGVFRQQAIAGGQDIDGDGWLVLAVGGTTEIDDDEQGFAVLLPGQPVF